MPATHRRAILLLEILGLSFDFSGMLPKATGWLKRSAAAFALLGCGCGGLAAFEGPPQGELVYAQRCAVCHDTGVDGAPVLRDPKSWAARTEKPDSILRGHVVRGYLSYAKEGGRAGHHA